MNAFEKLFLTPDQLAFVKKAYLLAKKSHQRIHHKYDGKYDYFETHILRVLYYGMKYIYLVPKEYRHYAIAILLLHDAIEDAHLTYNDVKKALGLIVAEGVFACTNEKGRTRKERANAKYYRGIRRTYLASFAKIADRMGNLDYGLYHGGGMIDGYRDEMDGFIAQLQGTHNLWGRVMKWFRQRLDIADDAWLSPMIGGLKEMISEGYVDNNYDDFKIGDYKWAA